MLKRFTTFIDASVGRRLAVGMSTMLLAGLAISTVFFVRSERAEMEQILRAKGKSMIELLKGRVAPYLGSADPSVIEREIRPVLYDSDLDYAFVFDDTHVIASASDPGVSPGPRTPLPRLRKLRRTTVRKLDNQMEILAPIIINHKRVAGLGVGVSLELSRSQGQRIGRRLLAVTVGLLTGALGFIYWWTRQTVKPLIELTSGAQRFSTGDLSVRVPVSSKDEMGTLASTFNDLAASLERTLGEKDRALAEARSLYRNLKIARARLGQAERLSAVGMLAAGISHELNNPLGIILSTSGNLREALGESSPWVEDVAIIEAETLRCRRIIEGLLNFAASGTSHPIEVDLNALLRETFMLAVHDNRAHSLTAEWALDPQLPELWVDARQMQQVFLNLLLNAADAMEGRGTVKLRTAESIEGGQRKVLIQFTDHGCGIAAADIEHIFDPFYTTKKGGAGFGLGLAVSYGIVAAHGGEITVASQPGRGSVFTITLPVQSEATMLQTAGRMS